MATELLLDLMLAAGVLIIAVLSLTAARIFTCVVLFISLGLLVTIIWARLNAWDVAIAEVAIGAGLTGSMLLSALRQLQGGQRRGFEDVS
jgi:uncharacterized MnhB-related membrane protein